MEQITSALTLFTLPLLSKNVLRPRLHTKQAVDFWIIVPSLIVYLLGYLVIAVAPSMAIAAIGVGLSDALRSFVTTGSSNEEAVLKLFLGIHAAQALVSIADMPLWSGFFLWILNNPSLPRSLLFLGNAGIILVCLLMTSYPQRYEQRRPGV